MRAFDDSKKCCAIVIVSVTYVTYVMTLCIVVKGKSIEYDYIDTYIGDIMADYSKWEAQAKGLLKAELKRRGITYKELVTRLESLGISETEPNIRNKLARGKFTAAFLLACLDSIGSQSLHLD